MEETLSSGQAYMFTLLKKWEELIELGEESRLKILMGDRDDRLQTEYIAKLTRLWLELLPIVDGRDEFGDIDQRFKEFRIYYVNPTLLLEHEHEDKLLDLEELIRIILHKSKVTYFSDVR